MADVDLDEPKPPCYREGRQTIHPNAQEGEQIDGWPGPDYVRMRCPDCGKTWRRELPQ